MASLFGMDAYSDVLLKVIAFAVMVCIAGHMPLKCCFYSAAPYLLWKAIGADSFADYSDGVLVLAVVLAVYAVPMFYKKALTFVATFPLAHVFRFIVPIIPKYSFDEEQFFKADGADKELAEKRRNALMKMSNSWKEKYAKCHASATELRTATPDLPFTAGRCFPPFNKVMNEYLDLAMLLEKTEGVDAIDIDGNAFMDISGSYGVNVCGYETYKTFVDKGWQQAREKGLFLGSFDETVLENVNLLREVSGHEEVTFHMSGTEAVMAAVRVARFNTHKNVVVVFGGAYHGWWDGMQPVVGNERMPGDVLCLKDMSPLSMAVIKARSSEIAAVVINPLQCMHMNQPPPSDPVLKSNNRAGIGGTPGYKEWLQDLQKTCKAHGVVLIFDEVYTGFRLHWKGAQGAYDVQADLLCYGKTLGGGLPIGVVCGPKHLMTRVDTKKAVRVAYAIGTFAGHPFVMACMNEFLKWNKQAKEEKKWEIMHKRIEGFIAKANAAFEKEDYPIQLVNWFSVWSILYTKPSRYHWMYQYYLKDKGCNLSWVGSGRLLFSMEWEEKDYERLLGKMLDACKDMKRDGWWEPPKASISMTVNKEVLGALVQSFFK
jgi:glutamate-1-semialdehyde 2,1-aminomutase|mmetsp:Transcript_116315/g.181756  ORF Transcript_116315/g.181756 Transcript_116315/m.181756 type:complete len:600 (-) Transcript_116315:142-1941(-)